MSRLLTGTRYLIVAPIIGLAVAASVFFIFGGQLHGSGVCEGDGKPVAIWSWNRPAHRRFGIVRRAARLVGQTECGSHA